MAKSRFETPLAFKQSLEQRLSDKAATTRTDLNRLRQVLVYERFLARVFEIFGEDAVLKGGIVLELRLERARATKDVDLGLRGNPLTILERLQEAGRLALGDFLTFEIVKDAKHPDILASRRIDLVQSRPAKTAGRRLDQPDSPALEIVFLDPVLQGGGGIWNPKSWLWKT